MMIYHSERGAVRRAVAWCGTVRRGKARLGTARYGEAWPGSGVVCSGMVRWGKVG